MLPPVEVDPGEKAAWEDYKNAVRPKHPQIRSACQVPKPSS